MAVPIAPQRDRKSTRLNSSHLGIPYAVFCLKKKKTRFETRDRFTLLAAHPVPSTAHPPPAPPAVPPSPQSTHTRTTAGLLLFFFFFLSCGAPPTLTSFPPARFFE